MTMPRIFTWRNIQVCRLYISVCNAHCCPSYKPAAFTPRQISRQFSKRCSIPGNLSGFLNHQHQWTLASKCSTLDNSCTGEDGGADGSTDMQAEENKNQDFLDRLAAARLELDVLRNAGRPVPQAINDADLDYFSTLSSHKTRKKFAMFLQKREATRMREKQKRKLRHEELELHQPVDFDAPMHNKIFLRLQNSSILQFDNWRLATGMLFGPKVAIDFSYDDHMQRPEIISMVRQLEICVGANKLSTDPFNICWAGLKEESSTMKELRRMWGARLDTLMVTRTEQGIEDIFPTKDIIYLTSDSPNLLRSYNPNKVYILGALVDSQKSLRGVSLAKAKRLNLDHARLPLDLFLKWAVGDKNLTLDQMMSILVELNVSGDWMKALTHVPTRKHEGLKADKALAHVSSHPCESARSTDHAAKQDKTYSFSRARQSRTWPVLKEQPFQRSQKMNTRQKTERNAKEQDPVLETVFNPLK